MEIIHQTTMEAHVGNMTLYFSYDTVIAFSSPKTGLVIRKNDWSTTTGKHLNAINPDKKVRINGEEFEQRLEELLQSYELVQNGGMQN
jgi:hypothetical protein